MRKTFNSSMYTIFFKHNVNLYQICLYQVVIPGSKEIVKCVSNICASMKQYLVETIFKFINICSIIHKMHLLSSILGNLSSYMID